MSPEAWRSEAGLGGGEYLAGGEQLAADGVAAGRGAGFVEMKARAGGFAGDDSEPRAFVDEQLRKSPGILLAT